VAARINAKNLVDNGFFLVAGVPDISRQFSRSTSEIIAKATARERENITHS
jgi:hypothetical protein